jgi:hypothetical protein
MDLGAWRDLIIVIWGIVGTIALIFICTIAYLFYKRTMSLLESADLVVAKVGDVIDFADREVLRPVTQLGTMIQGIIQGISLFKDMFNKKEEDDDE